MGTRYYRYRASMCRSVLKAEGGTSCRWYVLLAPFTACEMPDCTGRPGGAEDARPGTSSGTGTRYRSYRVDSYSVQAPVLSVPVLIRTYRYR